MTIANAMRFIKTGLVDHSLRNRLNEAETASRRNRILAEKNLQFSPGEFSEAFTSTLVQCQSQDEAMQVKEFKLWWDLLQISIPAEPQNN